MRSPLRLTGEIATRYSGAKLVRLSDLSDDGRGFFQKDHGDSCSGLVKVHFYGDGKPTLALVLIARNGAKKKAKLVLARDVGGRWETRIVDTADASPVPVVWSQPLESTGTSMARKRFEQPAQSWFLLVMSHGQSFTHGPVTR